MNQRAIDRRFEFRLVRNLLLFRYLVLGSVLFLFARLFSLQIVRKGELSRLSEANRIQLFFEPAPRGIIYDRNGKIIVANTGSFSVFLSPAGLDRGQLEDVVRKVAEILEVDFAFLLRRVLSTPGQPLSILLMENVPPSKIYALAEEKVSLPGISIEIQPKRHYLYKNFASHLLGYLGEIGRSELASLSAEGYRLGDIVGKSGIEKVYDKFLRGVGGGRQIETDAYGRQLRVLTRVSPHEGASLILTIDSKIQRLCEEALEGKSGAVCALDPFTGEVLAMVSKPDFDPNFFAGALTPTLIHQVLTDPGLPLFNRAIQSHYAPGSLFKIVTAIAGLEEGVIEPDEIIVNCRGKLQIGNREFKCWKKEGHGRLNIVQAIAQSCDVFFYQLGLKIGGDRLARFARSLGLGNKVGICLPGETKGLIPDSTWKKMNTGEVWFPGDTANMSIGQGYIEVTPLQMATFISFIANGEAVYQPTLVKKIIDSQGRIVATFEPKVIARPNISPRTLAVVKKGLREAVLSGTAQVLKFKGLAVCGKTGTSQNPHGEDHAWFICYAPEEKPVISLAVVVEHGGHGATAAAPIARKVLNGLFSLEEEKEPEIFTLYED